MFVCEIDALTILVVAVRGLCRVSLCLCHQWKRKKRRDRNRTEGMEFMRRFPAVGCFFFRGVLARLCEGLWCVLVLELHCIAGHRCR